MQGIYLILQRLKGVVALFLRTLARILLGLRDLPLFSNRQMPGIALLNKRGQHFINTINSGAAVNMAGDLRDDLRRYGGGGGDRFRRLDFSIAHFETVGQHAFQIDQHAVEHREERGVVEIVIVDLAALVRQHHIARQDLLLCVVFCHDPGQQISLRRDHFAVFVGILVQQRRIGLIDQSANGVM